MYQALDGRLIEVTKMGQPSPRMPKKCCGRLMVLDTFNYNFSSQFFLQLFRNFDYWPLNGGSTVCIIKNLALGNITEKRVLMLVEPSPGHVPTIKSENVPQSRLQGLLILMENISFRSSGMRKTQNFEILGGLKWYSSLDIFFSWVFSRLHFGGKMSCESF